METGIRIDPKPADVGATWVSSDEQVLAIIGLALEDGQLINVMQKSPAMDMWDALNY